MMGSEGRLGHWSMPEAEADMEQKTANNLVTLENSTLLLTAYDVLSKPDVKVSFTKIDKRVVANKRVRLVWQGMGGGALSELTEDGLEEEAKAVVQTTREHVLSNEG